MLILIIILIVVAVFFIINHNGDKHNEEMRKLAEQKRTEQSSLSQHNINNKIMDAVHAMGDGQNAQYWEGFKHRKPNEAKAIVAASRLNMDSLSDKDAFEVVNTFLRWSKNAGKPISEIKEDTIAQLSQFLNEASFETLESKLKSEMLKEAKTFNISPNHTACYFMLSYLKEVQPRQSKTSIPTSDIRSLVEQLLDLVFTHEMKAKMNEDMAYLFGSLVVDMVKSGNVDPQLQMMLPSMTIQNIKLLNKLYESGKVDKNEFDQILEESLETFAHQF
ncbi:MAG: hypothetical protein ACI3YC_01245 [Alloprevotella sp.]